MEYWDLYFDFTPNNWKDKECDSWNNTRADIKDLEDKLKKRPYTNEKEVLADQKKLKELKKCIYHTQQDVSWLKKQVQGKSSIENVDKLFLAEISEFIKKREGKLISISKWDNKQYTWWYWTKAPWKWLFISEEQALSELKEKVNKIIISLNKEKWFSGLNKNQKISLSSFFYNVWLSKWWKENLMYRLRNNFLKAATNMMLEYKYAGWNHSTWLLDRRKKEVNKFWS